MEQASLQAQINAARTGVQRHGDSELSYGNGNRRQWMISGIGVKFGAKMGLLAVLIAGLTVPAAAKTQIDFNPEINFEQYKTFAYLGGVNQLVMLQLNPDLISDRVHRSVTRELTAKGLREVKPTENPDLVVRYWANSTENADVSAMVNFSVYQPFIGSY